MRILPAVVVASLLGASPVIAQNGALTRGNVPGEWRYWGADAWSTPLLAARSDQRGELRLAEGRVAVERGRVRCG